VLCARMPNAVGFCWAMRWSPIIRANSVTTRSSTIPGIICRPGEEARRSAQRRAVQGLGSPSALSQVRAKTEEPHRRRPSVRQGAGRVLDHGLGAVDAACAEAWRAGIASGDWILAVLGAAASAVMPPSITRPVRFACKNQPMADCGRTTA